MVCRVGWMNAAVSGKPHRANSALRELVVVVAVLASVFIHHGGYGSPHAFIHGFTPAVWVAVGLSMLGIIAAGLTGGRPQPAADIAGAVPEAQAA